MSCKTLFFQRRTPIKERVISRTLPRPPVMQVVFALSHLSSIVV